MKYRELVVKIPEEVISLSIYMDLFLKSIGIL